MKEIHQDADAQLPHGVGDRGAHADRRHQHHDPREAEHRLGEALGEGEHRPPLVIRQHRQRDTKEHAEHHDLQHLALRRSTRAMFSGKISSTMSCHVRCPGCWICVVSTAAGSVMPTPARLIVIAAPSDEERKCRDDLEVDERLHAHAADLPQVRVSGDAHHQRGEQERRHDRSDETQEDLRQDSQLPGDVRVVVPDLGAGGHADDDPEREGTAAPRPGCEQDDGGHAQEHQHAHVILRCSCLSYGASGFSRAFRVPTVRKWRNWQTR